MNLILDIAFTHVRSRARQTLVAIAGVSIGVGFSIMMAALMQGSQDDFIRQLVNALPHITVSDERRDPPLQPAETEYDAARIYGLTPESRRRGIKNPLATRRIAPTIVYMMMLRTTKVLSRSSCASCQETDL